MASLTKGPKLADTPKPKRSPPPPPPPPRVNGKNSPLLRCSSPASSSCNGHSTSQKHYASSWRGSTTGIVGSTSSYNTATTCCCHSCYHHHPTHANHHHIHNNNDCRCQPISSSASAHGGSTNYNQMRCNQMACSVNVCRKLIEIQQPQQHHYNSNVSSAPIYCFPSSSMSSAKSQSSLSHSQHHNNYNNNNIYVPMSSSSDTHNNFVSIPSRLDLSNGGGNSTHCRVSHHAHNQLMMNQQDFPESSSEVSTSSAGCHHNNSMQMHNMCLNKLIYHSNNGNSTNTTTTKGAHRPCPPTPDQTKTTAIPNTPPPPPPIQQPWSHNIATSNRQIKPPVPSVRSLPKSPPNILDKDQHMNNSSSRIDVIHSDKLKDLKLENLSLTDISPNNISDASIKPQLSPLPYLKKKDDETFSTGPKSHERCSQRAYMRFMEHHYESTSKYLHERRQKIDKLKEEYSRLPSMASGPSFEEVCKDFFKKESINLRLKRQKMSRDDFELMRLIGRGVIGEVSLVRKKSKYLNENDMLYAMKTLDKGEVLKRSAMAHVWAERDFLMMANNEWIVKLFFSFQDKEKLYFIMEYTPGGDLMTLLIREKIFSEEAAKFYIAQISLAVQSVHELGVIHRDIKPDNILIDKDGHIKLGDFGQCSGFNWRHNIQYYYLDCEKSAENSPNYRDNEPFCPDKTLTEELGKRQNQQLRRNHYSVVGSTNYMAPEVIGGQGWRKLCDWWSVGVIFYEMIVGYCPFNPPPGNVPDDLDSITNEIGEKISLTNDQKIQYRIIKWEKYLKIPSDPKLSNVSKKLIFGLLNDVDKRLCQEGIGELKEHEFFNNLEWDKIRSLQAPWSPQIEDNGLENFPQEALPQPFVYNSDCANSNLQKNQCFETFYEFTYRADSETS